MNDKNTCLSAEASQYYWKGKGLCSIKTFSGGDAYYNTGKGNFRVDEGSFLVLNHDTEYSIKINDSKPVSSFCLFFKKELIHELGTSFKKKPEFLLDNYGFLSDKYYFFERTYPIEKLNSSPFQFFKKNIDYFKEDAIWITEQFLSIIYALAEINGENVEGLNNLLLTRQTTKTEIYRRVMLAREYLHYNYRHTVLLEEVAQVACLSLNHLLRCFKQIVGLSPHQYLINVKVNHAKRLLIEGHHTLNQICEKVGFESIGTFANMFKLKTGVTPGDYKKIKR